MRKNKLVAFMADVHIGNHKKFGGEIQHGLNARCLDTLRALRRAIRTIQNTKGFGGHVFVAGDMFDTSYPSPPIVAGAVGSIVAGAVGSMGTMGPMGPLRDLNVHLVLGNHDIRTHGKYDHAAAAFHHVHGLAAYWQPKLVAPFYDDSVKILVIPFYPANPSWFVKMGESRIVPTDAMEALSAVKRYEGPLAVVFHLGVEDDDTQHFLRGARDSVRVEDVARFCKEIGAEVAFAGNWHSPKYWEIDGVQIRQIGALAPTGFDNPGDDYGKVVFWDPGNGIAHDKELTIPGPRFYRLSLDDAQALYAEALLRDEPVRIGAESLGRVSIQAPSDSLVASREVLEGLLAKKLYSDGEVRVSGATTRETQKTLSKIRHDEGGVGKLVSTYIDTMEVPEDVDKPTLQDQAKQVLNGGS